VQRLIRVAKFFLHDPRQFLRYISVGALAASVEFTLFTAFYDLAGWPLLVANCTSLAIALILCFVLQKTWTFRARGAASRQLWLYLVMQSISAVLNNLLMLAFVQGLGIYAPVAKILQIGIVFIWNYTFCRLVVFARSSSGAEST
jgi:putative flippase GtrA